MDSGNSGSLQSSSGAEEECDSRAAVDSVSHAAFITTHHQPHPPPPFNHHMFDQNQINNPLLFLASPQHQLLNLDSVVWSKTLPSFSDQQSFPSSAQPAAHTVPFTTTTTTTAPITSANTPQQARNPKKRSRASRRAPTTVLTTDTNNFRAMVQEFTGIPAPPFTSSSSPFPRLTTGFDLFGRPSSIRSNPNNFDNLPQLPPYLLRPFPHKLQSSPSSSSSISSLLDSSNLLTTMQNTIPFPPNSLNQTASFLNPKTTQNVLASNGFGLIEQAQIHGLHTSLPDLVPSKGPAQATTRNDDQVASGNWDGGGVNYTNGKESSRVTSAVDHLTPGMKGDQGFIEPWICSSD